MPIFYKAVRSDGFDFYSRTVDYASLCGTDEQLPVKDGSNPYCCSDGVYHASVSKTDTLVGSSWPCRLFEVQGAPVSEEGNKRGFLTLKVIRELPAWEALGPNGEEIVTLIEKAKTVTVEQADALHAAWDAAWDAAWNAARNAARNAAGNAAWDAVWDAARNAAGDAARNAAGDAAGDAAIALLVKDLISAEHFNALYGLWGSVMDNQ